jgi:cytochrome c-type biogenesis protein CcmH
MNMGLAIALLGLTTLAVVLLVLPLILRGRGAGSRDAYNLAVYRDQLAEIDRDVGRGVIDPDQAEAAKSEIARRILALTPSAGAAAASSSTPLAVAAVAIILLPFVAWTLYWNLGSPTLPDQPYAARGATPAAPGAAQPPHVDMAEALQRLRAHLKDHPDDLDAWLLLARTELDRSQFKEAVEAYRHAVDLSNRKAEIVGDWGEAQVLAAAGTVTPAAQEAFKETLADPQSAPRSRYYLALAKLQGGDPKAALQDWVDLEADAPVDAEWLPLLRRRIAEAAKAAGIDPAVLKTSAGVPRKPPPAETPPAATPPTATPPAAGAMPSPAQVEETARNTETMTPDQRQAMVTAMVERLAARLQQQPDDVDGWIRLGRSYMVLNQPDKARDAYAHAAKLKPDDVALKQQYAEAIIEAAGNDDQPPAEAAALMRDVLAAEPQNAEALWYVGMAEAAAGHAQAAHDLWSKLLAELPVDAPGRKEVEGRLAALKLTPAK